MAPPHILLLYYGFSLIEALKLVFNGKPVPDPDRVNFYDLDAHNCLAYCRVAYESFQRGSYILANNAFPAWSIIQHYVVNWARAYALTIHYDEYSRAGYRVPKPSKLKHIVSSPMPEIFLCAIREVLRPMVTPDGRMLLPNPNTVFLPEYDLVNVTKIRNGGLMGDIDSDSITYGILFYPGLVQTIYSVFKGVNILKDITREGLAATKAHFAVTLVKNSSSISMPSKIDVDYIFDSSGMKRSSYSEELGHAKFKSCDYFIHDFTDESEYTHQFCARVLLPLRILLPERVHVDAIGPPVHVPSLQFLGNFPFRENYVITTHSFYQNIQMLLEGDYTPRNPYQLVLQLMTEWSDDLREFNWPTLGKQRVLEPAAPRIGLGPSRRKKRLAPKVKKQSSDPTGKVLTNSFELDPVKDESKS